MTELWRLLGVARTQAVPLDTLEPHRHRIERIAETSNALNRLATNSAAASGLRVILADAVVFLDPDVIVLDSALQDAADVVAEGVRVAVRRCAPPAMVRGLPIVPGLLGNHAHIQGALGLARTEMLWSTRQGTP